MAQQVYPPNVIIRTLLTDFFRYRGLALAPRGLTRDAQVRAFNDDEIISDMEQFFYVRLDALRKAPRGGRDWVVILILAAQGKYAHHGPDLRKLLDGVEAERPTKEGRLDEVIVVAEEEFFHKKNLTDVVREFQAKQAGGYDPDGLAPYFSAHPYDVFSCVIPENQSVPPHRIMSAGEVSAFLEAEHLTFPGLPALPASDPPIVWLGGREGQVVRITRPSQTAGEVPYTRRLEKGAL
jgi:DNA-directed RNA polymerase subunit H